MDGLGLEVRWGSTGGHVMYVRGWVSSGVNSLGKETMGSDWGSQGVVTAPPPINFLFYFRADSKCEDLKKMWVPFKNIILE